VVAQEVSIRSSGSEGNEEIAAQFTNMQSATSLSVAENCDHSDLAHPTSWKLCGLRTGHVSSQLLTSARALRSSHKLEQCAGRFLATVRTISGIPSAVPLLCPNFIGARRQGVEKLSD
jgi:hypothetical protein